MSNDKRIMVGYLCKTVKRRIEFLSGAISDWIIEDVWPENIEDSVYMLCVKTHIRGERYGKSIAIVLHPDRGLIQMDNNYLVRI